MNQQLKNTWLHISGTISHKFYVFMFILSDCAKLMWRALIHDWSKFTYSESKGFIQVVHLLKTSKYGDETYQDCLKKLKPCLEKHYARNKHHPEHFVHDINDTFTCMDKMSLIDLIEMINDWKAATKRHKDGDIVRSINQNKERFAMSNQLTNILKNSVGVKDE